MQVTPCSFSLFVFLFPTSRCFVTSIILYVGAKTQGKLPLAHTRLPMRTKFKSQALLGQKALCRCTRIPIAVPCQAMQCHAITQTDGPGQITYQAFDSVHCIAGVLLLFAIAQLALEIKQLARPRRNALCEDSGTRN